LEDLSKRLDFTLAFLGRNKKCTVQQYELNLSNPGCNTQRPRIDDVCGEFSCDDLIFPYYSGDERQRVKFSSRPFNNNGRPSNQERDPYNNTILGTTKPFYKKFDVKFVVFITTLPILLIGMLVFGLEIIIYFTCLRLDISYLHTYVSIFLDNNKKT
jgi:hypothetical protein